MPEFTEKQMAVGKEEFERRLAGLREYAYSDAHPILTRSIVWEVAYVDSLLDEIERLRVADTALHKIIAHAKNDGYFVLDTDAEVFRIEADFVTLNPDEFEFVAAAAALQEPHKWFDHEPTEEEFRGTGQQ